MQGNFDFISHVCPAFVPLWPFQSPYSLTNREYGPTLGKRVRNISGVNLLLYKNDNNDTPLPQTKLKKKQLIIPG